MDIGSGYPPSGVSPQAPSEAPTEGVAVVVEAQKANSAAITLDRVQITQYGDTLQVNGDAEESAEPPNTYNKFGKLPDASSPS